MPALRIPRSLVWRGHYSISIICIVFGLRRERETIGSLRIYCDIGPLRTK